VFKRLLPLCRPGSSDHLSACVDCVSYLRKSAGSPLLGNCGICRRSFELVTTLLGVTSICLNSGAPVEAIGMDLIPACDVRESSCFSLASSSRIRWPPRPSCGRGAKHKAKACKSTRDGIPALAREYDCSSKQQNNFRFIPAWAGPHHDMMNLRSQLVLRVGEHRLACQISQKVFLRAAVRAIVRRQIREVLVIRIKFGSARLATACASARGAARTPTRLLL